MVRLLQFDVSTELTWPLTKIDFVLARRKPRAILDPSLANEPTGPKRKKASKKSTQRGKKPRVPRNLDEVACGQCATLGDEEMNDIVFCDQVKLGNVLEIPRALF